MKVNEAHKILGVSENASKEDVRKAFKAAAKKYHPDINKEPGAEAKFKELNEAFQVADSGQASTREEQQAEQSQNVWAGGGFGFNIQDLFNNMGAAVRPKAKRIVAQDITLPQTLSFKEAVTGCQKDITYTHNTKCQACQGAGQKPIDNGCTTCKGTGQERIQANPFTTTIRPCSKCRGKISFEDCTACKAEGIISVTSTITVNIPAGATSGVLLNLGNRGHYVGEIFGSDQLTRLNLLMTVLPQSGLTLQPPSEEPLKVVHHLDLTLAEALAGCEKTVPTIDGDRTITIPPKSKHKDEIQLPKLGIDRKEPQSILLNVRYPSDISSLLKNLTS